MTDGLHKAIGMLAEEFALLKGVPLKPYTSFRIGGPADLVAIPETREQLQKIAAKAVELKVPITILGGGCNALIRDNGIKGIVIILKKLDTGGIMLDEQDKRPAKTDTSVIQCSAGEHLASLCRFSMENSLTGLEFAAGIPGTVGGAIMMNAGTPSGDMSGITRSVDILNLDTLTFETKDRQSLDFSYRKLNLKHIIVSARICLKKGSKKDIKNRFKSNLAEKQSTQPLNRWSAGCFFKNPENGKAAGALIELSGLKGERINDAMVSEKHANFIVNSGNASCEDVLALKKKVQQTVLEKFNIELETEVRILGDAAN